jgi:myosin heavy subunit
MDASAVLALDVVRTRPVTITHADAAHPRTTGIPTVELCHDDQLPTLQMLEGGAPTAKVSLLSLLNDESYARSTDSAFVTKLGQLNTLNLPERGGFSGGFVPSTQGRKRFGSTKFKSADFGVMHFSGLVSYTVDGFLEKNHDLLEDELSALVQVPSAPLRALSTFEAHTFSPR